MLSEVFRTLHLQGSCRVESLVIARSETLGAVHHSSSGIGEQLVTGPDSTSSRRGRDCDDGENEVDVSVKHLALLEWPLTIIWITTDTHLKEREGGRERGRERHERDRRRKNG